MARYTGSKCRLCRREGVKLFLKGDRCMTTKCAVDRRLYPPGEHGQRGRMRRTEYGVQLREKQKVKRIYGVLEAQFRKYFEKASRQKGVTGENLLRLLELRLDNIVYRTGFAPSRDAARQMIGHGHYAVNGRPVDRPSFSVKVNDVIEPRDSIREIAKAYLERRGAESVPWLKVSPEKPSVTLLEVPTRESIPIPIQEQLIVELYSK
ncbi:MAG TPA: 30S ribosomal protein S4 [bacterium]|nr:30S ribosomal protein S4 [bacterium]